MAGKKRCQFHAEVDVDTESPESQQQSSQCTQRAVPFAGMCLECNALFCSDHRLPEHHKCVNMDNCRQQAFQRNKDKLLNEQTVASKIVMA